MCYVLPDKLFEFELGLVSLVARLCELSVSGSGYCGNDVWLVRGQGEGEGLGGGG